MFGIAHHGNRQDIGAAEHDADKSQFRDRGQRSGDRARLSTALHLYPDVGQRRATKTLYVGHRRDADLLFLLHALDTRAHGAFGNTQFGGDATIANSRIPRQPGNDGGIHLIEFTPCHTRRPAHSGRMKRHPVRLIFQHIHGQRRRQASHAGHLCELL